jgi:hypothetical protein
MKFQFKKGPDEITELPHLQSSHKTKTGIQVQKELQILSINPWVVSHQDYTSLEKRRDHKRDWKFALSLT